MFVGNFGPDDLCDCFVVDWHRADWEGSLVLSNDQTCMPTIRVVNEKYATAFGRRHQGAWMASKVSKFISVFSILLSAVFLPRAAAAFEPIGVGDWGVFPMPAAGYCIAIQKTESTQFSGPALVLVKDRTSYAIQILFPEGDEPENYAYVSSRILIDSSTFGVEGIYSNLRKSGPKRPIVRLLIGFDTKAAIEAGKKINVYVGRKNFEFPLADSAKAFKALDDCFSDGAAGAVELTLTRELSIVRDAALRAASSSQDITDECTKLGVGLGAPEFGACRMMIIEERRAVLARSQETRSSTRADALLNLGAAILDSSAPKLPPTNTTIYNLGGRTMTCVQTGSYVSCH